MSRGVLPPVPDLIPISALQGCSMGEQRPRRRAPAELIDTAAGSRASSAAPSSLPPRSRPARPGQKRRKSDRRRELRRADSARSVSKQGSRIRSPSPAIEKPPRVNPIFVWVRQEDTRIVDVKCEDYDKRNRILLTKTAHGWKAIPRTETTVSTKPSDSKETETTSHHHHHHHRRHKHKNRRKSVSLQFPENLVHSDNESNAPQASWLYSQNVNIESLLPSHTIQIKRTLSSDKQFCDSVNTDEDDLEHALSKCSAPDKMCDVSPLENLLAVAELEFKQQMKSGVWKKESDNNDIIKDTKIESCSNLQLENSKDSDLCPFSDSENAIKTQTKLVDDLKIVECEDYNDNDDDLAMNDILSRLEQSLESPENEETRTSESLENISTSKNFNSDLLDNKISENLEENIKKNKTENQITQEKQNNCVEELQLDKSKETINSEPFEKINQDPTEQIHLETNLVELESFNEKDIPPLETNLPSLESVEPVTPILVQSLNEPEPTLIGTKSDNSLLVPMIKTIEKEPEICKTHDSPTNTANEKIDTENLDTPKEYDSEILTQRTNILEILSQEVEKIEPIKPNTPKDIEQFQPLDFSIKSKTTALTINTDVDNSSDQPTDLSIKKADNNRLETEKRPLSQGSEAIQSPQPSGIPAILHSPDIVSTSSTVLTKNKTAFLESLLANVTNKISFNSELTVTKQSESREIESRRKSASPTVTCSEEIINKPLSDVEPPTKKFKSDDITLKQLLDKEENLESVVRSLSQEPESPVTPALLKLLKEDSEVIDPLADFKKLLLEVDIPEPLMVPKNRFSNLLKNPRKEIFNLMKEKSYKDLKIDDILVVHKEKLFAALEANAKLERTISESKPNQIIERKNNQAEKSNSNKRKPLDSPTKNSLSESTIKNISASDIDAATEAAFSQMMMFPYQNQLEAMNRANSQQDLLQALYGTNTFLPGQMADMHSNYQMMMGNNRIPPLSPLGFPSFPPMNFTNPLEFSMWQEAMIQASLLRNKSSFENSVTNQPIKDFKSQIPARRYSSGSSHLTSNNIKNQNTSSKSISHSLQEQEHLLQKLYEQNTLNAQQGYLYLGQMNHQQKNTALNVPPYNPYQHRNHSSRLLYTQEKEPNNSPTLNTYREHEKKLQQQILLGRQKSQQKQQQERLQREQRLQERLQKPLARTSSSTAKPFSINSFSVPKSVQHQQEFQPNEFSTRPGGYQPIDLSGSQGVTAKVKGVANTDQKIEKSYASSTTSASKGHDDVAEVGSTTASIEEMQDANTHLWHPFFGSDKGYTRWNMSSMTSGE